MDGSRVTAISAPAGIALWIVLVGGSSILFSLALACATPFAALATASGSTLRRGPALTLVGTAWLANQAVGYGVLHYPRTPDSFAWGAAIGLAALAATSVVLALRRMGFSPAAGWTFGFALTFSVYESVLFAATVILPSGTGAFAVAVVGRILVLNMLALIGLAILHRLALAIRLLPAPSLAEA